MYIYIYVERERERERERGERGEGRERERARERERDVCVFVCLHGLPRGRARCVAPGAPANVASAALPLTGRALAVGVRKDLGGLRCLTLRYTLLLSVWVDPSADNKL